MKRMKHILIVTVFIAGVLMTCGDGMMTVFGMGRYAQYTWNLAFIIVFVPVFACHVIKRRGRTLKEE